MPAALRASLRATLVESFEDHWKSHDSNRKPPDSPPKSPRSPRSAVPDAAAANRVARDVVPISSASRVRQTLDEIIGFGDAVSAPINTNPPKAVAQAAVLSPPLQRALDSMIDKIGDIVTTVSELEVRCVRALFLVEIMSL